MTGVHIDPRTRLFAVIICGVLIFTVNKAGLIILLTYMAIYLSVQGMPIKSVKYLLSFAVLYGLQYAIGAYATGAAAIFGFMAFFVARFIPVAMAASSLSAVSPGELIAALQKLRLPKAVIIPLAVGLRFMPCIAREFSAIRDAMHLRGISPVSFHALAHPAMTMECIYVPLLMRSMKISDELAASASARGIDNPGVRTCLRQLRFRLADGIVMLAFFVGAITISLFFK